MALHPAAGTDGSPGCDSAAGLVVGLAQPTAPSGPEAQVVFLKTFVISVAMGVLGVALFDRTADATQDCKDTHPGCPPIQAIAAGVSHVHAVLTTR